MDMWKGSGIVENMTDQQREDFARQVLFSDVTTAAGASSPVHEWKQLRYYWTPFLLSWLVSRVRHGVPDPADPKKRRPHELKGSLEMWENRLRTKHDLVPTEDASKNPDYLRYGLPTGCWWRCSDKSPHVQSSLSPLPAHNLLFNRRDRDRGRVKGKLAGT